MKLYHDLGYCNVVDNLGDDWTPVKAARQSYNEGLKGETADTKLLQYLIGQRHTSPLEQASITYEIRMPIFVMRQFVRHRTLRLNEESARYTEMRDDFYIPDFDEWRLQNKSGNKQGSHGVSEDGSFFTREVERLCKDAYELYQDMIKSGIAKEQARIILPVNLMTAITVNVDLHNLMHFLGLRTDSHAQKEIQVLANAMEEQFISLYPVIGEIWLQNKDKFAAAKKLMNHPTFDIIKYANEICYGTVCD